MSKSSDRELVTEKQKLNMTPMLRLLIENLFQEDIEGVKLSPGVKVNELVAKLQSFRQHDFHSAAYRRQCLEMLYHFRSLSSNETGALTTIDNKHCRLSYCQLGMSGYYGEYEQKSFSKSKSASKGDEGHFMIIFQQTVGANTASKQQIEDNVSIYFLGQNPEKALVVDTDQKEIETLRALNSNEDKQYGGSAEVFKRVIEFAEGLIKEDDSDGVSELFCGAVCFLAGVVKVVLSQMSDLTQLATEVKAEMVAKGPSVDAMVAKIDQLSLREKKKSIEMIEKQQMLNILLPINTQIQQANKSLQDAISKSLIGKKMAKPWKQEVASLRGSYAKLFSKLTGTGQVPKVMYQKKISKLSGEVDQFIGALENNIIKASNILPPMRKNRRELRKVCTFHLAGLNELLFRGQAKQVKKSLLYGERNTAGGKQLSAREEKAQLEQDIAKLNRLLAIFSNEEFLDHFVSTLKYRDQVLKLQENSQMVANVHMSLLCPSLVDDELSRLLEDYHDLLKDNEVLLDVIGSLSIGKGSYEQCLDGVKSEVATKEKVDPNGREGSQKSGGSAGRAVSVLEEVDFNACSPQHSDSLLTSTKVGRVSPKSVLDDVNAGLLDANTNNLLQHPFC